MAKNPNPTCPQCGSPCRVAYGQWYCDRCRAYPFLAYPSVPLEKPLSRTLEEFGESVSRAVDSLVKSAQQQPACPICRGSLEWVPQYQRWYCRRCQQYA